MHIVTKKGARSVTRHIDRLASLMQEESKMLGLPEHIANDMAFRCDLISDAIEKNAGIAREALDSLDVHKEEGFDPEVIGEEKAGPFEDEPDESYMTGEFTQQENRELREKVEDGELSNDSPSLEPQAPRAGVQAALTALVAASANTDSPHVERAIRLALDVAKAAGDDEDDEDKGEEKKASRKRATHGFNLNA